MASICEAFTTHRRAMEFPSFPAAALLTAGVGRGSMLQAPQRQPRLTTKLIVVNAMSRLRRLSGVTQRATRSQSDSPDRITSGISKDADRHPHGAPVHIQREWSSELARSFISKPTSPEHSRCSRRKWRRGAQAETVRRNRQSLQETGGTGKTPASQLFTFGSPGFCLPRLYWVRK